MTAERAAGRASAASRIVTPSPPAIDLGRVDRVPRGEGRAYAVGDRAIAVFHTRDGALFAIDDRCPLGGGPLADGLLERHTVVCPVHARAVDLSSGHCIDGIGGVRTYPVYAVDGRIRLVLGGVER